MASEPVIDAPVAGRRRRSLRVLAAAAGLALTVGLTAAAVQDRPSAVVRVGTTGDPSPIGLPDLDVPTTMAAEPTTTSVTTPTTTSVTTPTTVPVAKVPLPTITSPTLPRPRPTTTTTTTTGPAASGGRCGTRSGSGDLGATRSVTRGTRTVTLEVYACEHYDGEFTQNFVHVDGADVVLRAVHLDFGDGTATDVGVYRWACNDPHRPNPYHANGPFHTYAAAGSYTVTATVTTTTCSPTDGSLGDDETVAVSLTTYQIAGPRPPPPH